MNIELWQEMLKGRDHITLGHTWVGNIITELKHDKLYGLNSSDLGHKPVNGTPEHVNKPLGPTYM
jgi:hypothetical protein